MRIDWYTKGVLTVIAGMLGVIALRPYVSPDAVQAQGSFAGVQFSSGPVFFDSRSGEMFIYPNGYDRVGERLRATKPGAVRPRKVKSRATLSGGPAFSLLIVG